MASKKEVTDNLRNTYLEKITEFFAEHGEHVLRTGTGEVTIPCLDMTGEDAWVQIIVKIPRGSNDGDPFNGYDLADDYELNQKIKAEKKAKTEAAKAAKIEKDKKRRAAKQAQKERQGE